jgi:DNA helicase-2/ATP-dependent DNA helicase PcrA
MPKGPNMRRLSQTQIRTWRTCPQKWKQIYLEGRKEPPSPPLTFGSAVHAGLETFYRDRLVAPASVEELFAAFDSNLDRTAYASVEAFERARAEGRALLQSWHDLHAERFKPAMAVELALTYQVGDVPMISILDRVDLMPDGRIQITDYKTGRYFLREKAVQSDQLTLYQVAAEDRIEREVESLSLVHVPSATEWTVPRRTPSEIDAVRRLVLDTADQIERGLFEPRTGRHCDWCHVKPWCPAFADRFPENWERDFPAPEPSRQEIAGLADAFGAAQARKREAEQELAALRQRLTHWFEESGERVASGSEFRVRASRTERTDDRISWRLTPAELSSEPEQEGESD